VSFTYVVDSMQTAKGGRRMKSEEKKRMSYEKPAVVLEKDLEALAADCGTGSNNTFLGGNNCKGAADCTILYS
jgi:hypothetical protein